METQNFTHRLYIEEYDEEFVRQLINGKISGLQVTDESTEKVLVVVGSLEDLNKLAGLMYRNEHEIKAVFPDFLTVDDYNTDVARLQQSIRGFMAEQLCWFCTKYNGTSVDSYDAARAARQMLNTINGAYFDVAIEKK